VTWKRKLNDVLAANAGVEVRRVTAPAAAPRRTPVGRLRKGDRLVAAPVFILCTLRSGSTLLRVLLDSHTQIHSPHELHLRYISASLDQKWSERSMKEMGLDQKRMTYLLWDRILHRELSGSGKPIIADKTPNNVFIVEQLKEAWPDARFIFLLRHPAAIARSRQGLKGEDFDPDKNVDLIRRYCEALDAAHETYPGHTVRYEDLTADPARETRRICEFLGVPWEPAMLEYGQFDHGRFKAGLGDWADKIKTGRVQAPAPPPPPDEVPEALRLVARKWGYLPQDAPAPAAS
jgi:hypothetical protein